MINAENIGKRIRALRKQMYISQERMALDLGFYQADISNMERATGNSGITDIVKLDMIADYFGISLTDLISEEMHSTPISSTPTNVKLREYEPDQYQIIGTRFDKLDSAFISEIKLKAPTGKTQYVSFLENDIGIYFFQTRDSLFAGLQMYNSNRLFIEKHIKYCFLSGEDYDDIFSRADTRWVNICRYLIYIATEGEQQVNELIQRSFEKRFCNIDVPKPDREPSELVSIDWTDLSAIYRYRLLIETNIKNPSVYTDIDNLAKREKLTLEKLKAACVSEEAYKIWKKDLIDAKVDSIIRSEKIVVCDYLFAGMGQYKEIMPESQVECFKCWINGNGSAFFCGSRPATKREIRSYAAKHITEELW